MKPLETPPRSAPRPPPAMGFSIAALILGILGVMLSPLLVGGPIGVAAVILGVCHLRRSPNWRTTAGWGTGLGIAAILATLAIGSIYLLGFQLVRQFAAERRRAGAVEFAAWEGVIAPDLQVHTLDGQTIRLSDLRGRRVILDFWATWCPPCVKEIPHFIQLTGGIPRDQLVIVGVSEEEESVLREFVRTKGVNYPVGSAEGELPEPYRDVSSIPTTFIIDRNGIIQTVLVGYHDLETLRSHAVAADYSGTPKPTPQPPTSTLPIAEPQLKPTQAWSKTLPARNVCAGDFDGDGRDDLLVVGQGGTVRVFDEAGNEKPGLSLPAGLDLIEIGRHREKGRRLLAYSNWGNEVMVVDPTGRKLWTYPSSSGVDGAHWGDLDGDGTDEMIVGMNGGGGLHAVSADGIRLWRVGSIGNVWNQAVVPATPERPALVFATEAGGSIRVYSAQGKSLRTVRPLGEYFSQMTASRVDAAGKVQAIAQGKVTVAFDESGKLLWQTPAKEDHGAWRTGSFAHGDLDGDGVCEWIFREPDQTLAVVSADGKRLASLPAGAGAGGFCVVGGGKEGGLLVTLSAGRVDTHRLAVGVGPR